MQKCLFCLEKGSKPFDIWTPADLPPHAALWEPSKFAGECNTVSVHMTNTQLHWLILSCPLNSAVGLLGNPSTCWIGEGEVLGEWPCH